MFVVVTWHSDNRQVFIIFLSNDTEGLCLLGSMTSDGTCW